MSRIFDEAMTGKAHGQIAGIALQLHADDFQLVTPLGVVLSKEQYLGAVAAGDLHYLVCEFAKAIRDLPAE